jgi:hypothetical protein
VFPVQSRGENGNVERLRQRLFSGANSNGFVVFQKIVIKPKIPHLSSNYYAFTWSGNRFLIAQTDDHALTNLADFSAAQRLYGFDGEDYWSLAFQSIYRLTLDGQKDLNNTHSTLMVISKKERNETNNAQVAALFDIDSLAKECRRVAQFGFSFEGASKVEVVGTNLLSGKSEDGKSSIAEMSGDENHPVTLRYIGDADKMQPFQVLLDYSNDVIQIDRLSQKTLIPANLSVGYRIIFVHSGTFSNINSFSWQAFKEEAGHIIGETVNHGNVVQMQVGDDGKIEPGKVLVKARQHPAHDKSRLVVYCMFAIVSISFLGVIGYLYRKNHSKNN